MKKIAFVIALLAVFGVAVAPMTEAASVTVTRAAAVDAPNYDLTATYGTGDWAIWAQTAAVTAPAAPSNRKSGATMISSMTNYGGNTGLSGSTSASKPVFDFDFTDGASPASGTVENPIGVYGTPVSTQNAGVQITVTAPTAAPFTIYVWACNYECTGRLIAIMEDLTQQYVDVASPGTTTRGTGSFFTVDVDPDSVGETITIRHIAQTDTEYANVSIAAVAVKYAAPITPGTLIYGK